MSRFFSGRYSALVPYTPGEQPKDKAYIKLNTNEMPFAPLPEAVSAAAEAAGRANLYPDPDCTELSLAIAENLGVKKENVIVTNGSDEALNFAFMAFCDAGRPAVFPDITYGFYPVFAKLNGVPYFTVPLRDDFTVSVTDYVGIGKTVFLANPNAPTGLSLHRSALDRVIAGNRENVVIIDEAYVDFGAESCVPLIEKYDNLLVVRTFSKSRSLAGMRLGFAVGCRELIDDLRTIKYSTNPYNVNRATAAAGTAVLAHDKVTKERCRTITETREKTKAELQRLGFEMTDSAANFVFVKHPKFGGEEIYLALKEKGILVRHFDAERIRDYNRITIGTDEEMSALVCALEDILGRST